jgi:hypothetical protein
MDYVAGIVTSKLFIANCVICFVMLEMGLKSLKPLYQRSAADKERDAKYPAFKRNDLKRISRPLCYLFAPLTFVKWMLAVGAWAYLSIVVKIVMIG